MTNITFAGIIPNSTYYTWDNVAFGYCNDWNNTEGTSSPYDVPPGTKECTEEYLNYDTLVYEFS